MIGCGEVSVTAASENANSDEVLTETMLTYGRLDHTEGPSENADRYGALELTEILAPIQSWGLTRACCPHVVVVRCIKCHVTASSEG